ncbi:MULTISPECIES: ATP-binding protein [Paenibacillus]|uniref:histidine kinase n=1 Tax=Paenibacillus campinasensis TaxID=66347 RepID=A0A268EP43_9BACL|nr:MULTISPECIES: ATP-binding protein [Paenibacillus]MUG66056.1 PAS domain S-box protein [Paenibacillus campinasensis]PAD74897.1 PAS domain-containing sensor histidine kinase [Paenibacillus campinasensis]PAK50082.1 PAS domain-containing sensor histidine kinase [Paenibacillus sp. 7541]
MLSQIRESELQAIRSFQSSQLIRNKYENILENLDSGIILFDADGVLTFVNVQMAKLLGVPRKSLTGCTLTQLLRHPQLSRFKKKKILRLFRETIFHRRRFHELVDEYGRSWLITMTYGDQMEGDFLISVKDVSDFKQIEQTAYQNDKLAMLGKISASIAHEIRNPLTSIRGFIQLLRPHLVTLGKDEYARIILTEIDRANDIIYEFLNSSKPSAPETTVISVSSLLKEVVLLTESEALMKGCQIILHTDEEPPTFISVDVKQIKQVILNIIKNALDAIDEREHDDVSGRIEISTQLRDKHVNICISDNGGGMDQNTLNHLFNPFFTTKESGTGLGLSVSYRIIKNHGGSISVDSQVGAGTEFVITFPKLHMPEI